VTDDNLKFPVYLKVTILLVGSFVFLGILYLAQDIIIPLVFALIIAIVLHPVVNFFVRIGMNRIISISLTMILTFLVIVLFGALLISEISTLGESWPLLVNKFTTLLNQTITDASEYFEINPDKIHGWISRTQDQLINASSVTIGQTFVIIGGWLVFLFLLPVYIFLILFYQPILIEFIHRLFGEKNQNHVSEIISQTKTVIQRYLIGRLIEMFIVATLNSIALLVIGIEYALILGIIGALVNIIPYVGGVVAIVLPMMVALVTKSSPLFAVYVFIAYYIIQMVDNHYIVPIIVASKVKINALFSIIVVLAGNALWGIPGMFLSIPLLAIVKLICDRIEPLKPLGFLLGDTMPPLFSSKKIKEDQ
jgi:predicted PurR-regulated permease PerM